MEIEMNRIFSTIGLGVLLVAALDSSAFANCKPGTSHCVTANGMIPKFCGSVSKPCTIDGGLGGTCKGDVVCGNGETSPLGDLPWPASTGLTVGGGNTGAGFHVAHFAPMGGVGRFHR
jgi:hypothetical protein